MKVESGRPVGASSVRGARGGDRAQSGAFSAQLASVGSSAPATAGAPVGRVNVLAAFEAVDEQERRHRAKRRGTRVLDLLDDLRLGLLSGGIPRHVVADLSRALSETRDAVDDPGLLSVLDEIDLRAQVELAKHEAGIANG